MMQVLDMFSLYTFWRFCATRHNKTLC